MRSLVAAAEIAAMAVAVVAKDAATEGHFGDIGFMQLQRQAAHLFLPMRVVTGPFV